MIPVESSLTQPNIVLIYVALNQSTFDLYSSKNQCLGTIDSLIFVAVLWWRIQYDVPDVEPTFSWDKIAG